MFDDARKDEVENINSVLIFQEAKKALDFIRSQIKSKKRELYQLEKHLLENGSEQEENTKQFKMLILKKHEYENKIPDIKREILIEEFLLKIESKINPGYEYQLYPGRASATWCGGHAKKVLGWMNEAANVARSKGHKVRIEHGPKKYDRRLVGIVPPTPAPGEAIEAKKTIKEIKKLKHEVENEILRLNENCKVLMPIVNNYFQGHSRIKTEISALKKEEIDLSDKGFKSKIFFKPHMTFGSQQPFFPNSNNSFERLEEVPSSWVPNNPREIL